jgi:hypothetical protein
MSKVLGALSHGWDKVQDREGTLEMKYTYLSFCTYYMLIKDAKSIKIKKVASVFCTKNAHLKITIKTNPL